MTESTTQNNPVFLEALRQNEQDERIKTGKVASALVVFLMPAGFLLDFFVYNQPPHDQVRFFLLLRLLCSVLVGVIWYLHYRPFGTRHYKWLGMPIAWLPAFFIGWMIYVTEGPTSPYYAGLNLILLAVSVVVRWNIRESFLAVSGVVLMYSAVTLPQAEPDQLPIIFNNFYFLILTGIIVVTGNYFFNQLRLSEFTRRFELRQREQELQTSNEALNQKTGELEQTLVDLREAQEQLVQKGKEELMGQVSSGIVHDVGNLLAPVGNYLFKLKKVADALPEDKRSNFLDTLVKIEKPMNAARGVLGTLQRYAHSAPQMSHECPIHGLMEDALNLVRPKCEEAGIQIKCQVDRQFIVIGQPLDLTMVFKNLLDNAIDATKVKAHVNEAPTIWVESRLEPQRGFLIIRDNGTGIPPGVMGNLFKPYNSTKGEGNGTGLGLVTCQGTVSRHGGKITVRSEPDQFTEFTVELPRHTTTT